MPGDLRRVLNIDVQSRQPGETVRRCTVARGKELQAFQPGVLKITY